MESSISVNQMVLFVIHVRSLLGSSQTFSVSGLKEKVHHIENLQQLFTCILPEQIDIPPFVLEYDTRVNSPYYTAQSSGL
ncbi:ganglioside-induced differentiation-associated protein 2-like [Carassius auratus]|uniref:Ganglioside-induced differentiation-associated protein 2-like n=1 Tax=Carassius auratus TaxID=7957 RepID=A0A6P6Q3C9_CARAU|nr:ganglioside-induced differentiation-associated protein 2-like [Carassius auratus]